jgi:hypothetical protein
VCEAFKIYKNVNQIEGTSTFSVPHDFVIPQQDKWPDKLWDTKLGDMFHKIKTGAALKSRRNEFEELGFDFQTERKKQFLLIFDGLKAYKIINNFEGVFTIPPNFVVPESNNWPKKTWGLNLGVINNNIKCKDAWKLYRKELIELGIDYFTHLISFPVIQQALITFKRIYKVEGSLAIPSKFIIPTGNHEWPVDTWGIHLGMIVNISFFL